jgi:hypothetical protein
MKKTVELTEQEWNALLQCAALAPYAQVAGLINNVVQQLQKQATPPAEQ